MKLPFNPQDMSPFLSEEAIKYHYSKHHATYVKNLNNLSEQHKDLKSLTLEDIIKKYDGSIHNNAGNKYYIFRKTYFIYTQNFMHQKYEKDVH
ncbi:hypothetical protein PFTANZ_01566 [Plasmodium falciparum Tanzania (2000708)]|nr:hypothetical protein PFTANZ_01566 [Plasmodium falciparum Tanzania (2000708)]